MLFNKRNSIYNQKLIIQQGQYEKQSRQINFPAQKLNTYIYLYLTPIYIYTVYSLPVIRMLANVT